MGKKLSVLLAGGGTAGHVNPLLATAHALEEIDPQLQITAVGTKKGLETELVPAAGFPLATIPRTPFPRRFNADLLRFPRAFQATVRSCRELLIEKQAAVVVGFGGYASAPMYLAAKKLHIPVVVHEANARAGLANKLGARFAALVALTFPSTDLRARRGATITTGLPLRAEIARLATDTVYREELRGSAASEFDLDPDLPTLVVTGGSSGAVHINEVVAQTSSAILERGIQVLHISGKGKAAAVKEILEKSGVSLQRYHVIEYLADMEKAYALADLVITRAGAGMVAEISALGIPAVFVPLPIGNGEQALNAQDVVHSGGALLVSNADFTGEWLQEQALPLFTAHKLPAMAAAARAVAPLDGAAVLAQRIVEIIG